MKKDSASNQSRQAIKIKIIMKLTTRYSCQQQKMME